MVKVVGELFYGNSHTTDPEWIKAFQERDYKILSVIMNTKLETCINRVLVKRDNTVLQKIYENRHKGFERGYAMLTNNQ